MNTNLDISRREALKVIGAGAAAIAASSYGLGIFNPPRAEAAVYPSLKSAQSAAQSAAIKSYCAGKPTISLTRTKRIVYKKIASGKDKGKIPVRSYYKLVVKPYKKTGTASYYTYVTKNKKRVRTTKKASWTASPHILLDYQNAKAGKGFKSVGANGGTWTFNIYGYNGQNVVVSAQGSGPEYASKKNTITTKL